MPASNLAPFAYFGGKWRLLPVLKKYLPPSNTIDCYGEPCFGSGTLFFNVPKFAEVEVINDYNSYIYNFFKVLRDDYESLVRLLRYTPYSKQTFLEARNLLSDGGTVPKNSHKHIIKSESLHYAWALYLIYSMSIYRNGRNFSRDSINHSKAREWKQNIKRLQNCADRLSNATIENEDALETLKRYDSPRTFFYIDPPYKNVLNPRSMKLAYHGNDGRTKKKTTLQFHESLMEWALQARSQVVISNYHNELYDQALIHWNREEVDVSTVTTRAARGTSLVQKAHEVIWSNFERPQLRMF